MKIQILLALAVSGLLAGGCASTSGSRAAVDRALERHLRDELNHYGDLANEPNIQINAFDGMVTLSGTVRSEKEREMIESMTRNTSGVVSVSDQLAVITPPLVAVPPVVTVPPAVLTAPTVVAPVVPVMPVAPSAPAPVVRTGITVAPGVIASTAADEPEARRILDQFRRDAVPPEWLRSVTITVTGRDAYVQGLADSEAAHQAIVGAIQRAQGVEAVYDQLVSR